MITLTEAKWATIDARVRADWAHKPSVFLMRSVMKRELGFTVRKDTNWNNSTYKMITTVYLDFFNAPAETMFRLRYL
jgi:hypothetical protein